MSTDPTRSSHRGLDPDPDPGQTRPAAPDAPDGGTTDLDPSALPPHLAGLADRLAALVGEDAATDATARPVVALPRVATGSRVQLLTADGGAERFVLDGHTLPVGGIGP
jgi:hypothetical protein